MGGKCWGGWIFVSSRNVEFFRWAQQALPRSLIFIFLRSRACSISRAWHFAILLRTALACSFGCGPSSCFAKGFEAFSFSFRGKTTKIQFLRTFSRFGDGMGWLHGCTTIVLSCRLGFACAAVQPALCRRERLREKHGNPCMFGRRSYRTRCNWK